MLILLALTIHFVSICFKPNKISKELYKNINKIIGVRYKFLVSRHKRGQTIQ